jgi:4-amino-4-deoxy-L-arabinose transferase-like glycosyltransferase
VHTRSAALPRPAADSRPDPPSTALIRSLAAATLVAAALRLFRLGHQSLWVDETFTWASAGGGGSLSLRDLLENVHGPLYSLALHAWMRIAGESEWALRFPSALAGILTVPAMAWLAWRWLGREVAAPAAWLAAGSPFLLWYAQETRNYAWLMLWTAASLAALFELRARGGAVAAVRVIALSGAGLLTNLSFALLAPLQLRAWLGGDAATRRGRRLALAVAAVALLAIASPWIPQVLRTWDWRRLAPARAAAGEPALRGATTFHPAALPFALHAFAVGYTLGPSLRELRANAGLRALRPHVPELAATALTFGILGGLGIAAIARRRATIDLLLWVVAPAVLVSYFASQNFKVFHPRYLAVAVPGVLLVFAAGLADLPATGRRLLGAAVALLWIVSLQHHYFVPAYGREDYRGALARVKAGLLPGEQLIAAGAEEPVSFYSRPLPTAGFWLGYAAQPATLERKLDEALARAPGTWIVLSRPEDLDPAGRFAATLEREHPGAEQPGFEGVRLWHVLRTNETPSAEAGRPKTAAP